MYSRNANETFNMLHRFLTQMGGKFKVLVQQKGLAGVQLSGFRIADNLKI